MHLPKTWTFVYVYVWGRDGSHIKFQWKTMIDPMMRFLRGVYVETGSVKRQQSTHKKPTFKQIYNLKKKKPKNILRGGI